MIPSRLPDQTNHIKPYSKKELTAMYNVSKKTMTRWLKPHLSKIGKREGRYYNVKQILIIFDLLGLPDCLDKAACYLLPFLFSWFHGEQIFPFMGN